MSNADFFLKAILPAFFHSAFSAKQQITSAKLTLHYKNTNFEPLKCSIIFIRVNKSYTFLKVAVSSLEHILTVFIERYSACISDMLC